MEYEIHFEDEDEVGTNMAEFAIASISTMASTNRQIQSPGLVPYIGSRLQVHWYYVIPLLSGVAGVDLGLFVAGWYATRADEAINVSIVQQVKATTRPI